jgi:GMP reductase
LILEPDIKLDFNDVLLAPKRSKSKSRKEVNLVREYKFPYCKEPWKGTGIIASNMDTIGTEAMHDALWEFDCMTALHKFYGSRPTSENGTGLGNAFVTTGPDIDLKYWDYSPFYHPLGICIDSANGHTKQFVDAVKKVRNQVKDAAIILAGNVTCPAMVQELILAGADIVKVGIGPSKVCDTRMVTGCGYPQLSAIIECADAAHHSDGMICSDGGCKTPGDIVKAFAAGADFVMRS